MWYNSCKKTEKTMKYQIFTLLLIATVNLFAGFLTKATSTPQLLQIGIEKEYSPLFGKKLADSYKTSYIAKLKTNGRIRQYCCIDELALDMQEYGIDNKEIKVIDAETEKFIPVQNAYFVIKSKIKPNYGKNITVAFEKEQNAKKFSKKFGGETVDFKTALALAQKNLKSNIRYMNKIYKKKIYPMGKKIYKKKCKEIDITDYIEINELEADIKYNKICGNLREKYIEPLALYLWNVKRKGDLGEVEGRVIVKEDEKCPVCGMFTYKYPRWAAQIFYKHGSHEHHFSFDGVKDMMKFYFNPMKWGNYPNVKKEAITKMLVTDYYSQKALDARNAYYVIGSNIYGPMGHELIPFATLEEAQNFKKDHRGEKILKFDEIKESLPYELDNR